MSPAHCCTFCVGAFALGLAMPAFAENAQQSYYQDLAMAGGQADALSLACGRTDQEAVMAHRARLRQRFAAKGLSPSIFDQFYDSTFNDVTARTRVDPAATKQVCAQLVQGLLPSD